MSKKSKNRVSGNPQRRQPQKPQTARVARKTFSPATIGTILGLLALGIGAILIGSGAFSSTPMASNPIPSQNPNATQSSTSTPTPSASESTPTSNTATATPTSSSASTSTSPNTVSCTYSKTGNGKFVGLPNAKTTPFSKRATIVTNSGTIVMELLPTAPCTENSFAFLASNKFYDGTPCHRLLNAPGFTALQCGDPTGSGSSGPGYQFADESLAGATYPRGSVAMANAGPGTNGSQFFFVFKDSQFAPNYTPFGRVVSGMEVIDAIAAAGTSNGQSDGAPKNPVSLTSVKIG